MFDVIYGVSHGGGEEMDLRRNGERGEKHGEKMQPGGTDAEISLKLKYSAHAHTHVYTVGLLNQQGQETEDRGPRSTSLACDEGHSLNFGTGSTYGLAANLLSV